MLVDLTHPHSCSPTLVLTHSHSHVHALTPTLTHPHTLPLTHTHPHSQSKPLPLTLSLTHTHSHPLSLTRRLCVLELTCLARIGADLDKDRKKGDVRRIRLCGPRPPKLPEVNLSLFGQNGPLRARISTRIRKVSIVWSEESGNGGLTDTMY